MGINNKKETIKINKVNNPRAKPRGNTQAPRAMYLAWLALVGKSPWELAKDCPKGKSLGKGY